MGPFRAVPARAAPHATRGSAASRVRRGFPIKDVSRESPFLGHIDGAPGHEAAPDHAEGDAVCERVKRVGGASGPPRRAQRAMKIPNALGAGPTGTVATTEFVAVSMTETLLLPVFAT